MLFAIKHPKKASQKWCYLQIKKSRLLYIVFNLFNVQYNPHGCLYKVAYVLSIFEKFWGTFFWVCFWGALLFDFSNFWRLDDCLNLILVRCKAKNRKEPSLASTVDGLLFLYPHYLDNYSRFWRSVFLHSVKNFQVFRSWGGSFHSNFFDSRF